jgi:hypothetical protein
VSSAILYGAIVVIWAGVLIPRWLRRETSSEEATVTSDVSVDSSAPSGPSVPSGPSGPLVPSASSEPEPERPVSRESEHARVIGARRRLLGMLLALAIGAGVLAVMKLAAWWVVLPPSVMLIGYLALLREASRADAERRWAAVEQAHASAPVSAPAVASAPVVAPAPVPAPDAEIIDITARVELYDQVADAKLRAVGD